MTAVRATSASTVVTAGAELFAESLESQSVEVARVAWTPPVSGSEPDLAAVLLDPRRTAANAKALQQMLAAAPRLTDVRPAGKALGLPRGHFLHAGPPIAWDRMSGPLRGALLGAAMFEGLAETPEGAETLFASGALTWEPCHHRQAVGPMAGVVSGSMWVFEVTDDTTGRRAWCTLNEGLGKVLRYGAYSPDVLERLDWMTSVLGPALRLAVRAAGPADLKSTIGQMLQMGDEGHNRNRSGTLMMLREWFPHLVESGLPRRDVASVARFIGGNDHFFLNLAMPACALVTASGHDVAGSSVVTTMARNGTDFGIRVSGAGDAWFTGPARTADGLYLGDYGPEDANPDIGDSAVTETAGIGGFAMATAPAIVRFVGGSVADALATTARMHDLCVGENPAWAIPVLDFRGAATGIDVTAVVRTGLLPQINTGIAGRQAGTGQVGAGLVTPPMDCFTAALAGLAAQSPVSRRGRSPSGR